MTEMLVVGLPGDPLRQRLVAQCQAAGQAVAEVDLGARFFDPRTDCRALFYCDGNPDRWPDLSLWEGHLSADSLIFVCAWGHTATQVAPAVHVTRHVVGFSPLGLFADKPVVEIAAARSALPDTLEKALDSLHSIGLKGIPVRETPGLVLARIWAMLVNEAASALMEGMATPEDIDTAMTIGTNYPQGPLAWADTVGLDVVYNILTHLHREYGEERYRPMWLLRQKVAAGELGRKVGEGFYTYAEASAPMGSPAGQTV
jgi:3-hydroxybutyryl-CoA dehydrogenase